MTVASALFGLFCYPDFPDRPNRWAFWLSKRDKAIAIERLERCKRLSPNPLNLVTAKRAVLNPITWHMVCIYTGMLIAPSGSGCECHSATDCPLVDD